MIRTNSRTVRVWLLSGVAAIALAVAVVALLATLPTNDPNKVVLVPAPATSTAKLLATFPAIPRSRPAQLTIPSLKIDTSVGRLGLQADGEVMVPTNTHTVGWYIYGVTPGQIGSAVILGHVDSYLGPGTFFNLKLLKAGDHINLVLQDGTVTHFVVDKVVQYAKTNFPDKLVYGTHGTRSLQLVTCGGTFDHDTGHYESNVVVFSQLVSVSIPKRDRSA